MSEDPTFYRGAQSTTDGVWSARYAIDDQKRGRLALVIEQASAEGQHIVTISLNAGRARELRWLLTQMLIDAGEENVACSMSMSCLPVERSRLPPMWYRQARSTRGAIAKPEPYALSLGTAARGAAAHAASFTRRVRRHGKGCRSMSPARIYKSMSIR